MNLKQIISENNLAIFLKILPDRLRDIWQFAKNNARCRNRKSQSKFLSDILMLTHALEKAFSLPNPRKSFGLKKASSLLDYIERYISQYGYQNEIIVPVSVMLKYIDYHKSNNTQTEEMSLFEKRIRSILPSSEKPDALNAGGTYDLSKEELIASSKGNFETLAANRFAIRSFSDTPVPDDILHKALDIARKSPSACNRQSYRVHVFRGDLKNRLLKMQGGANSFYETADAVLLISADTNRYYTREYHLGYVDASLYAMTLMYALTYLGVGSIPLTLGIRQSVLDNMKKQFSIPENEIPVLLVAIGNYPERFKVAMSHRNDVESFTKFH